MEYRKQVSGSGFGMFAVQERKHREMFCLSCMGTKR